MRENLEFVNKHIDKQSDELNADLEFVDNSAISLEPVQNNVVLCPQCIASGKAAKKFKFEFNSSLCLENCSNKSAQNEVIYKTPSVYSMQEFLWPSCCDDMCQYVGNLADEWHDISKIDSEIDPLILETIKQNETFVEIGRPLHELIEALNQNAVGVLVFRCLHCGKYRVIIDLD